MIFASLQLSPSASWLAWLIWIALAACIGGISILVGLSMEKHAGKEPSFTQKSKSLENCGMWLVILGVFIEILSTGAFAIRGEIEMRHIRQQEYENDPLNRPIRSVEAFAFVWLSSTNGFDGAEWLSNASLDFDNGVCLTIMETNSMPPVWAPFKEFSTNQIDRNTMKCALHFVWPSANRLADPIQQMLGFTTVGELDKTTVKLFVPMPCSKVDIQVSGQCSIIFNGEIERRFNCIDGIWEKSPNAIRAY